VTLALLVKNGASSTGFVVFIPDFRKLSAIIENGAPSLGAPQASTALRFDGMISPAQAVKFRAEALSHGRIPDVFEIRHDESEKDSGRCKILAKEPEDLRYICLMS